MANSSHLVLRERVILAPRTPYSDIGRTLTVDWLRNFGHGFAAELRYRDDS